MEPHDLLLDIHALEEDLLSFERKYGVRSDLFYAAYAQGEEPEDEAWMLDFGEWGSVGCPGWPNTAMPCSGAAAVFPP